MHVADMEPGDPTRIARAVRHSSELLRLAGPVMASRVGIQALTVADAIMLGRYGTDALAGFSMGLTVLMQVMLAGIGLTMGTMSETARHHGAGRVGEAAATWRRGMAWSLATGVPLMVLCYFGGTWLRLIGQAPELVAEGGQIARILAPGLIFQMMFVTSSLYLEAMGRPLPGFVVMALANLVNLAGNALLIFGLGGFPELGATGAAIASGLARMVLGLGLLAYVLRDAEIRRLPRSGPWGPGGFAAGHMLRRIGLATGAAFTIETLGFGALTQVAGLISAEALAAYSVVLQVQGTLFMLAFGLSVAAAVRVGQAAGAGRLAEARFAGWSALVLTMGLFVLVAVALAVLRYPVARIFSADPALIERAVLLLPLLGVSLIFDAGQVVLAQCNRALGDGWGTTARFIAAFWGVMLPLGIWLGLGTSLGAVGLILAVILACVVAVLLLGHGFHRSLKRLEAS